MKLSNTTRIILGVASLSLIATFFVPLWQIMLWAPQYPEGLEMKIWHNNLSGSIDIINGLNHYIGMKHISVEMFPEFGYIGLLIGFLMLVGLVAAALGSGRVLFFFTLLSYGYGFAALYDFWAWGYDYGHNLDPNAAIKVPDMSYQPPLIGYKNLLNFTSYSGPDTGAWIIIAVCLLATVLWWWEFFKNRKKVKISSGAAMFLALTTATQLTSCAAKPEPIRYGEDNCYFCKMTLTDKRYGAELVTQKGKVYKFDDLNCLCNFIKLGEVTPENTAFTLAVDFNTGQLTDVHNGFFLSNESLKSPMRADIASFANLEHRNALKTELGGGQEMSWQEVRQGF
ncbi:MAG: nitrous oxide reductase accessory protein NosL [Saprospiraceae bacterium]|nr:nitrous oxide reductase accessory protein NosL [Saprospiraceae bacterium]